MNLKKLTRIILIVAVLLLLSIVPVNAVVFNAAFDSDFYVNCYPDLKAAFGNDANAAYNHYLTYGIKEGRIASPVFDVKAYIRNYPDLQAAFGNDYEAAYNHFLTNGMNEGRLASDSFNVQVYIANYPDLQAAFGNDVAGAYNHYLNYGMAEGRVCGSLEAGAEAPEDHVHAWKISKVLIAPSCVSDGEANYICECGETKTDIVPMSADYHDYQEVPSGVANVKIYKCTICNDTKSEVISEKPCDHDYVEIADSKIEPKCTIEGKIFKQCTVCKKVIEEVVPKIDHVSSTPAGQGKILVGQGPVKCEKDGAEEVTCDVCKQKFTRTISAHNYEKTSEVEATCATEGVVTYKCKDCGATKVETTDMIEHSYTDEVTVTTADCEHEGLTLKVCKVCGVEKRAVTEKTKHTATTVYEGWAEIDLETGKYDIYTDETATAIKPDKIDTTKKAADCEHDLIKVYKCTAGCNKIRIEVLAKKTGHRIDTTVATKVGSVKCDSEGNPVKTNGKYVVTEGGKADCQHAEVKLFKCANCGLEEVAIITEKSTHIPDPSTVKVYGATCIAAGYRTFTCTSCNEQITEATTEEALGHNYVYTAAKCGAAATIKCTRCAATINPTTATGDDLAIAEELCAAAGLTKIDHDTDSSTPDRYVLGSALTHDYTGDVIINDNSAKLHCRRCGKDDALLDLTEYNSVIAQVEALDEDAYTDTTYKAVTAAVEAAQAKLTKTEIVKPDTTQEAFDTLVEAITTAIEALEEN